MWVELQVVARNYQDCNFSDLEGVCARMERIARTIFSGRKACGLTCSPLAQSGIQLLALDGTAKGAPERRHVKGKEHTLLREAGQES